MFRDKLLEELAQIFGETIVESNESMSDTAESIYIDYSDAVIDIADDKKIYFSVPFSLSIYTDRNDFAFGYLTENFSAYKPNDGECNISADDDIESPFWVDEQTLGISKKFTLSYSTEYNKQTKKLSEIKF